MTLKDFCKKQSELTSAFIDNRKRFFDAWDNGTIDISIPVLYIDNVHDPVYITSSEKHINQLIATNPNMDLGDYAALIIEHGASDSHISEYVFTTLESIIKIVPNAQLGLKDYLIITIEFYKILLEKGLISNAESVTLINEKNEEFGFVTMVQNGNEFYIYSTSLTYTNAQDCINEYIGDQPNAY